ncbi:RT0821/Lpp0805 family surface protein [Xanthobacter sp. KR7-65]|uniref:RT0821/Lpp0805 family surface protein n=1 Tax=Xanthobacter sp. KR7-65 TaxID=3156612 RepID=UPI0032B5FFD5
MAILGLALAGCASVPAPDDDALVTGSIRPTPAALRVPEGAPPKGVLARDWDAAKLALDQALASREKDVSIPWDNPETGARGTATPVGPARAGGCRDFMISLVDAKATDRWIQGEACRAGTGTTLSQVRVLGRA